MAPPPYQAPWGHKEYWIFCDESVSDGSRFSDFFGGVIVPASSHASIEAHLAGFKASLGLTQEVKWQRVGLQSVDRYKRLIAAFFDLMRRGEVRYRVMFRPTDHTIRWTADEKDKRYFKLYYQFIKHAFGLCFVPQCEAGTRVRFYFDQFPDTFGKIDEFKDYLKQMPQRGLKTPHLRLNPSHIVEIDSKMSAIIQCVDVIVGAMAFGLNEMHLVPPKGGNPLGKRTLAKFSLYCFILTEIRTIYPYFLPEESTSCRPFNPHGRWQMHYRHWNFRSRRGKN